jgi:5'-methylthioadenosine phosphorylase
MFTKSDKVLHIPIEPPFCPVTRSIIIETAQSLGIQVHQTGTAVVIEGPRFSTKAESNLYRMWNADLVNMTLTPEVIHNIFTFITYSSIILILGGTCKRSRLVICYSSHGYRL